ncbi:MAG: J domain-containing protein, partial [Bacteroidia bacterium]
NDIFVQSLIGEKMINIGLDGSDSVLPGYYLFKDSRLVGYHPGTFDISKLDPSVQKTTLWFGIAMGVLSGITTKSFATGLLTFSAVMDASTGMNIFKFFKEILESKSELDIRRRQKIVFLTEIDKAYALLRVSKTATDEEVKKAWKRMLVEFHPDKSKDDKEKRTKLTVSINEAYEIIMSHRKAVKNKFSFS